MPLRRRRQVKGPASRSDAVYGEVAAAWSQR